MFYQLVEIFFNVITPVFALVFIGYWAGPKLGLQARTLSRLAYFILIPSFIFNVMSTAKMEAELALRMVGYTLIVHVAIAGLAFLIAKLQNHSIKMVGAYVVIAVFGNVGNFGLPLIEFRLGTEAITAATVYFLAIVVIAFVISVAAASWHQGGKITAVLSVLSRPQNTFMTKAIRSLPSTTNHGAYKFSELAISRKSVAIVCVIVVASSADKPKVISTRITISISS